MFNLLKRKGLQKRNNPLGHLGENFAVSLLLKNNYKILERNFRSKFGEIDIVALKDKSLIFLEVKARTSRKFGLPQESVTYWKLKKIEKTGQYFSLLHPNLPKSLRIEIVALEIRNGQAVKAEIIPV